MPGTCGIVTESITRGFYYKGLSIITATDHAGEAATKALKLYDDADVLKVKPGGEKTICAVSLVIVEFTLQVVSSASLSFERPAGRELVDVDDPHASVTFAGEVRRRTAQR